MNTSTPVELSDLSPRKSTLSIAFAVVSIVLFSLGFWKLDLNTGNWKEIKRIAMTTATPYLSIAMFLVFLSIGISMKDIPHFSLYLLFAINCIAFGISFSVLSIVLASK